MTTNIPGKKRLLNLGGFLVISIVFAYTSLYRKMHWPNIFDSRKYKWELAETETYYGYYDDERGDNNMPVCSIPSKIIKNNFLELFVVYRKDFDDYHEQNVRNTGEGYLSDIYEVFIDDSSYYPLDWIIQWNEKIDQTGTFTMIPIGHLENGKHLLRIDFKFELKDEAKAEEMRRRSRIEIPFWKDSSF